MGKKKPIPMPGFNEAVATLGDWAAKLGAVEVRPCADPVTGYCLKTFDASGKCVGVLRWRQGRRWHVVVGMGSWSVTPANRWSVEEMDRDTQTAIHCRSIFPVESKDAASSRIDTRQTTLALEP